MDWATKTFTVYQADMTFLGGVVYKLDVEALRTELHALQWGVIGITFEDIFFHNTEVTISGTTFVRVLGIINGYTMTISPAGAYQVSCTGANHNLQDVYNNLTGPTLLPNNSAGLIAAPAGGGTPPTPAAVADAVWDEQRDEHTTPGSYGEPISLKKTTVAPEIWKQE
jgi:hypothetical protein